MDTADPPLLRDTVLPVLERTPALLEAWLPELGAGHLRGNEGGATFSALEVVAHLIHGERTDWMARLRMILETGPARPFAPFDRRGHGDEWRRRPPRELVAEFRELRARNLADLRALRLDAGRLALEGTHPALGRVTLGELLATWAAHDLDHVAQIARVLAVPLRGRVGPWREYLPLLKERRAGG